MGRVTAVPTLLWLLSACGGPSRETMATTQTASIAPSAASVATAAPAAPSAAPASDPPATPTARIGAPRDSGLRLAATCASGPGLHPYLLVQALETGLIGACGYRV